MTGMKRQKAGVDWRAVDEDGAAGGGRRWEKWRNGEKGRIRTANSEFSVRMFIYSDA